MNDQVADQNEQVCRLVITFVVDRVPYDLVHMGCDATKPVFGVSDKATLKSVSSAAETSYKIEISLVSCLVILS